MGGSLRLQGDAELPANPVDCRHVGHITYDVEVHSLAAIITPGLVLDQLGRHRRVETLEAILPAWVEQRVRHDGTVSHVDPLVICSDKEWSMIFHQLFDTGRVVNAEPLRVEQNLLHSGISANRFDLVSPFRRVRKVILVELAEALERRTCHSRSREREKCVNRVERVRSRECSHQNFTDHSSVASSRWVRSDILETPIGECGRIVVDCEEAIASNESYRVRQDGARDCISWSES